VLIVASIRVSVIFPHHQDVTIKVSDTFSYRHFLFRQPSFILVKAIKVLGMQLVHGSNEATPTHPTQPPQRISYYYEPAMLTPGETGLV